MVHIGFWIFIFLAIASALQEDEEKIKELEERIEELEQEK